MQTKRVGIVRNWDEGLGVVGNIIKGHFKEINIIIIILTLFWEFYSTRYFTHRWDQIISEQMPRGL